MILVCHVILRDHSLVTLGQEPIQISYHPAKFVGHGHSDIRDIMCLVCRVILT